MASAWLASTGAMPITGAVSHATAGLDYQLTTTTCCKKHGTFHPHSSIFINTGPVAHSPNPLQVTIDYRISPVQFSVDRFNSRHSARVNP